MSLTSVAEGAVPKWFGVMGSRVSYFFESVQFTDEVAEVFGCKHIGVLRVWHGEGSGYNYCTTAMEGRRDKNGRFASQAPAADPILSQHQTNLAGLRVDFETLERLFGQERGTRAGARERGALG
jgi:hypothetical protein